VVVVLDPRRVEDIIVFWNLRAMGHDVLPVPADAVDPCLEDCKRFVCERSRDARTPTWPIAQIMAVRQELIPVAEELRSRIPVPPGGNVTLVGGAVLMSEEDLIRSGSLRAGERTVLAEWRDGEVAFNTLTPEFFAGGRNLGTYSWANVVDVSGTLPDGSTVMLPPQIPALDGTLGYRLSAEGVIVICSDIPFVEHLRIPDGAALFRHYAKQLGVKPTLSPAGRLHAKLIEAVGGAAGVDALADEALLRLLDRMAHGAALLDSPEDDDRKPRARGRAVRVASWLETLCKSAGDEQGRRRLRWLIDRGVLELGLTLPCDECGQRSWHALATLRQSVECERCLSAIPFPSDRPPREQDWAYRSRGIFTVENYVQGAYTASLVLRWFSRLLFLPTSWAPGTRLEKEGLEREVDLSLFLGARAGEGEPVHMLCECKSYLKPEPNKESVAEVVRTADNLRQLARWFPAARFTFALLAKELAPAYQEILMRLAVDVPLIVLTGEELFATEARIPSAMGTAEAEPTIRTDLLQQWAVETQRRHLR
jgi:hypothetical protein